MNIKPFYNAGTYFAGLSSQNIVNSNSKILKNSANINCCTNPYHCDTVSFTSSKTHLADKTSVPQNVADYLGDNIKHLENAKEILNNTEFTFETDDGEFKGTLRGYFEDSIVNKEREIPQYTIYHGTTREVVDSILDAGKLDYTKTNRVKCGPGTYFTGGMGSIFSYGSCCLNAEYIGNKTNMPAFKNSFYVPVDGNKDIINKLISELNIEEVDAQKLLKVCAHDILTDDMDIDILYASGGHAEGCFVVLNDECMKLFKW